MSVVMYRRVSSEDQRLDRQEVADDVDRVFEEKVSGKDRDRPELAACLAYLRPGDTLRCHSVDRLARSLPDLLHLLGDLTGRGVRVEFVKERKTYDTGSRDPLAMLELTILGAFAEYERAITAARRDEGIALAKERGAYKGRKPALSPADVRLARQRRRDGVSLARLVRDYGVAKSTMQAALVGEGIYGAGEYAA